MAEFIIKNKTLKRYNGNGTNVVVPDEVVKIDKGVFSGQNQITGVILPKSVVEIGDYAFEECYNLSKIMLSSNLRIIGRGAFQNCIKLKSITIPKGVEEIGDLAFSGCAFKDITLPEGIKSLNGTFYKCDSLSAIKVPAGVCEIKNAFSECKSLTSIEVDENNKHFISVDGVLFTRDRAKLISYPAGSSRTEYQVPDGVVEICDRSFIGAKNLLKITFPNTLTKIGECAMADCHQITEISLPKSVCEIRKNAFYECKSLKKVNIENENATVVHCAFQGCYEIDKITMPSLDNRGRDWWRSSFEEIVYYNHVIENHTRDSQTIKDLLRYREIIIDNLAKSKRFDLIVKLLEKCDSLSLYDLDDIADQLKQYNIIELNSEILELKGKLFTSEEIINHENDKIEKAIGLKEMTLEDYKRIFTLEEIDGGIKITGCNKRATFLDIPEIIEGKPVIEIEEYAFRECKTLQSVIIPKTIKRISTGAFHRCESLEVVVLPKELSEIGEYAFDYCKALKKIDIPKGVRAIEKSAFSNSGLVRVDLPSSLLYIGDYAFSTCQDLEYVSFPDGVEKIGEYAFHYCFALKIDKLPSNLKKIERGAFDFCYETTKIEIPSQVEEIGEVAFRQCEKLKSVTIRENVKKIGRYAFRYCDKLTIYTPLESRPSGWDKYFASHNQIVWASTDKLAEQTDAIVSGYTLKKYEKKDKSLEIPSGILRIGTGCFIGNKEIVSVKLPDTVKEIRKNAFRYCTSLAEINLEGLDSIDTYSFYGCKSLTKIEIPKGLKKIGRGAFYNCQGILEFLVDKENQHYSEIDGSLYTRDKKALVQYALGKNEKQFIVPEGVTKIGKGALALAKNLEEIVLPTTIEEISGDSFYGCENLRTIAIPSATTKIGGNAFYGCKKLTILAEATKKPVDWHELWKPKAVKVCWNRKRKG